MAISDDLNSIRTHLEDDYTALETLGVSVEDRNIENIKDMANQIYAKFPKTSYAEGSNITLSNTLKGKLDFEDGIVGYGDTKQNTTQGYNLYKPNVEGVVTSWCSASLNEDVISLTAVHDGEIFLGNAYPSGNPYVTTAGLKIPVKSSTTYRISVSNQEMARVFVTQYNESDVSLGFTQASPTFTTQATTKYVTIRFGVYTAVNNQTYSTRLWLYEGSTEKDYEPYTGGQASPNPSYPQDIEVVRGKNRFDGNVEQGAINSTAGETYAQTKVNNATRIRTKDLIVLNKNETYTISCKSGYNVVVQAFNDNKTLYVTSGTNAWVSSVTFTNIPYIAVAIKKTSEANITPEEIVNAEVQLEKSSQVTSYLPFNTLEVVERGGNEFNVTDYNNINLSSISGTTVTKASNKIMILTTNTLNSGFYMTNNIWNRYIDNFKSGKTYTLSFDLKSNANTTILAGFETNPENTTLTANTIKRIVTTTSNTSSAIIVYNRNQTADITLEVTNIMISEDSNLTTYEPYQTPKTYQLSLGEYEFAKIGNYVDTIEYDVDEDKVYKNEKIKKIDLSTIASFTHISGWANQTAFVAYNVITHGISGYVTVADILCNRLIKDTPAHIASSVTNAIGLGDNANVFLSIEGLTTSSDYVNYFDNNPTYLYAPLATPIKTEITGTLADQIKALYNAQSNNGTTIIEIDGQLPMIIKVRALKAS